MLQALGRARAPNKTQIALGAIILLAYGCSLFAAQVQPEEGSATQRVLKTMEYSFAVIFTVEILASLFSHSDKWFRNHLEWRISLLHLLHHHHILLLFHFHLLRRHHAVALSLHLVHCFALLLRYCEL